MPAAAVIPAPIGYIKVVAVEKLVVVFVVGRCLDCWQCTKVFARPDRLPFCGLKWVSGWFTLPRSSLHSVTESKLECSKQALQL